MKKLPRFRDWVPVGEAAQHLSSRSEKVSEVDVLRRALDGHLTLSVNFKAISEFPKWRKYLIYLSFLGKSSVRPVQVGGFDVNIVIHRSTAVRGRGGPVRHHAWPPSLGAILSHTDGPCGS